MLSLAFAATVSLTAAPKVSNVTLEQDSVSSRKVTITYKLETEPAIVTVDILTNGVSIGEKNLTCFAGDVNRVVQTGDARTILNHRKRTIGRSYHVAKLPYARPDIRLAKFNEDVRLDCLQPRHHIREKPLNGKRNTLDVTPGIVVLNGRIRPL